ncbi:MAG: hypothetical protein KDB63_02705, partial [Nocardioidaceae bacterium]|nr:hypothetical protein [Nocardioidaceae bacterium]
ASCDELNEWADKLQDRLVSDRKQAIIGEGVVARDKSLRDDAAADLQKARDEAVAVLDAEQAALSDYLEVAPLYDAMREVKPGVWVIVHSQIAKGVDASLPEGRALLDAMDASKVALEIEREAQNDFDEAAHTYADVTSALDGLYDEIDGLERQLRDIGKATEACKTMP